MAQENYLRVCLIAMLVVGIAAIPLYAQVVIERGPYVQNVSQTSALIAWTTNISGDSVVEYWSDNSQQNCRPQSSCRADLRTEYVYSTKWHNITLTDLLPATDYSYQVLTNGKVLTNGSGSFRTAPAADQGSEIGFVVFGDSGLATEAQFQLAGKIMTAGIDGRRPDLMLHVGDIVYGGTDFDVHQRFYDKAYFNPYREIIRHVPMFPIPGNHEYDTSNAKLFLDNFYLPGIKRYYSFDYGNVHFVALDSELLLYPHWDASGGNQLRWLEEDLQKSNAVWNIVYIHKPPFSSGNNAATQITEKCPVGDRGGTLRMNMSGCIRSLISPIIQKYNADIVFSGHDHIYEVFRPMMVRPRPGPTEVMSSNSLDNGVVYLVTGGGGAGLYSTGQTNPCVPNHNLADCRIFPIPNADGIDPRTFFHLTKVQILRENHTLPMALKLEPVLIAGAAPEGSNLVVRKDVLTGRVTDGDKGVSNAEVKVFIRGRQRAVTRSDPDGRFQFYLAKEYELHGSRQDAGTYQIKVTAPSFTDYCEKNIRVPRALDPIRLRAGSSQPCSFKNLRPARWTY